MRVLILYDRYHAKDSRTRIGFAVKLEKFCDILVYGPNEDSKLSPIVYDKKITAKDLLNELKPDILFFMLYSYDCYNWLPKNICKLGVPSAIVEEDHYEERFNNIVYKDLKVLNWYKDMGFSLLLRRHFYREVAPIPSVWLPFSADDVEFNSINGNKRLKKIGFAGSYESPQIYYDIRKKAILKLKNSHLLAENYGKIWDGYASYLRAYMGHLACTGGILHTPLAKTFEIPLSGSALLTNRMNSKQELWGGSKCYFEYKDDCSNIIEQANTIINDYQQVKEVTSNALKIVKERHTDSRRVVELYDILTCLHEGKEIPRVWGQ